MRPAQLGILALAFLAALDCRAPMFAINPVMPRVVDDLGLSFTLAGAVTGVPLLMMGLLSIPGGWLADRFGPRRTLAGALAVLLLAALGRAFAPSGLVLLGATVVLGAAIGSTQPALARVARDTLPHNVPLASSVYFYGYLLGGSGSLALTPAVLIPLFGLANWRPVVLTWSLPILVALLGWLLVARGGARGDPHARLVSLAPLRASAAIPGVPALTVAMGTQSAIFYAVAAWLPATLTARGWSVEALAVPLAVFTISGLIIGFFTAPSLRALGYRGALVVAGVLVIAGVLPFLFWPDQAAWVCALGTSVGTTFAFAAAIAAPAELAPPERVGTTAGFMLALGYVQAMLGPFLLGLLRDLLGSYTMGWWLLLGMGVLLLATALGVPRRNAQRLR